MHTSVSSLLGAPFTISAMQLGGWGGGELRRGACEEVDKYAMWRVH